MKLNYDCIRDVLLFLEENLNVDEKLRFSEISVDNIMENKLISERYSIAEVAYTIHNLYQCDFINVIECDADNELDYVVCDVTYLGHEFLAAIHDDNIWNKIKTRLLSINITSIPAIIGCANNLLTALLKP